MDPKSPLDYALFQLTPTRTRCDLIVFSGKKSEKVASGLVEPFVAHLKYAKDQIPKGGYSIALRPPPTPGSSSWFTKATFIRFVRFVSTPEILERITRIEREILQIDDSSVQSGEIPCPESTFEDDHGGTLSENSRVRLQRLMDSRKALLQKEQAMAYARAVVAGYEIDTIDDLICFAGSFGASRLREACIDFKELYKKKHSDDQWMDELAAVKAHPSFTDLSYMPASGIMLSGENIHSNGTLSDSISTTTSTDRSKENNLQAAPGQTPNIQQQVPWMNHLPPHMYNFQGQIPPYYPYYPSHMGWSPPGAIVPSKNHKPSRKKEKSLDSKGSPMDSSEEEEEDEEDKTASSESDDEKEQSDNKKRSSNGKKRHAKNSKKTVIIRNINYIASKGQDEEGDGISGESSEEAIDSSIREGVDNAIASLERRVHKKRGKQYLAEQDDKNELGSNVSEVGKGNSGWDAFQNLLLSHEEPDSGELPKHHIGDEHFVMKNSNGGILSKPSNTIDFSNSEGMQPGTRKIAFEGENVLFNEQFKESKISSMSDFSAEEKATIRTRNEEDWFTVNNNSYRNSETRDANKLEFSNGLYKTGFTQEAAKGATVVDDSFMIESRSAVDEHYMSRWRTDINVDADIDMPKPEKGRQTISSSTEPNDLSMMLVRESRESNASRTQEMDYEAEISLNKADKRSSIIETNGNAVKSPLANGKNEGKKNASSTTKRIGRDMTRSLSGSLAKSKIDSVTKSKKVLSPAMVKKDKLMKEEEERKRMEEAMIQRQKRIAERTAASGLVSTACKKLPVGIGSKSAIQKPGKNRSPGVVQKISQAKVSA